MSERYMVYADWIMHGEEEKGKTNNVTMRVSYRKESKSKKLASFI